ncbi:DUF1453 domain-containing protein [Kitasatospora sp. McL0602]|uniref:DUF1453 domain-containing protein n=1 Tax=Kitasatospora sp. McL0602 TaxID=3439530 RepID=UPI003F8A191B
MNGALNTLVIVAVAALVIGRQFRARRLDSERRVWLIPLVLAVLALRDPALLDSRHVAFSVLLLAAGVVVEIALGSVWGWTAKLWYGEDGGIWVKGTPVAMAAWAGMLVLRGGLYAIGAALGVHQGTNQLLLALAALLLVRGVVLQWRARTLAASYRVPDLTR